MALVMAWPLLPGYVCAVSYIFIMLSKLKVNGAHAPLGPTVDTLGESEHEYIILTHTTYFTNCILYNGSFP